MIPTPPTSHTMLTTLTSGEWRDVWSTVRSETWAALAKLAWPVLEIHHGDLYHDAMYLDQILPPCSAKTDLAKLAGRGVEFFYAVNPSGTQITFDRTEAEGRAGSDGRLYVVTLRPTDKLAWQLVVTEDTRWRELA